MDIRSLSDTEEEARLEALDLAAHCLDSINPLAIEDVQILYNAVVEDFRHNDRVQIALGIAFGEAIREKAGWEWVRTTDEWGAETSIAPQGYAISCHPISMIQKRIADGVVVDLVKLRDETIATIRMRIAEGLQTRGRTDET